MVDYFQIQNLAYIDGGSGSLLIQVLIAGVLGVGVTIRAYWTGITGFLTRRRRGRDA
jgi:hypothetical protein